MDPIPSRRLVAALALALAVAGCSGRDTSTLPEAPLSTDPVVFDDDFNSVDFQFFGDGALQSGLVIDTQESSSGDASLRIAIPNPPDWTGGAFPSSFYRDLSGYTALTFWAMASESTTFNEVGLGNDNSGESRYQASWSSLELTPVWKKYVVPIPLPKKLAAERGMFFFADAVPTNASGVLVWFDDVVFEDYPGITDRRPSMAAQQINTVAGTTWSVAETQTTFSVEVDGAVQEQVIRHLPGYFDFASSDESVATVDNGLITVVGTGTAEITATFDGMPVDGTVTVTIDPADPTSAAPPPTVPEANVIAVFSNAYSPAAHVPVARWSADWDQANYTDLQIDGDDTKLYELFGALSFAGIEYTEPFDASAMTHVHMDVWSTDGSSFKVKLVDFGPNGVFDGPGSDDSEHSLLVNNYVTDQWVSVELALADFTGLTSRGHFAQFIFEGISLKKVYVDNIYFHN